MYADNTTIFHLSNYLSILQKDLNSVVVKLQNWLRGNKISVNFTEKQLLIIGSRPNTLKIEKKTDVMPYFELEELKIQMVNDIKLLGVKIDDKLQWSYQVEEVKANALQVLGLIKHAKRYIPLSDLQKIYGRFFSAHFS